jgi:putative ABC transport system permease protein
MIPLSLRFAARELRSGVKGFRIFLACLAVGVAAIAAAASTAEAFRQGLASQAREILGGDLSVTLGQREFTPAEQASIGRLGAATYAAGAQAMAQSPSGERRLVQLRGVDDIYPLAGVVEVTGAPNLRAALQPAPDGTAGAAVEPALLDRLGLKLGDRFLVGQTPLIARAILVSEPDRIGRMSLGPRVLTTLAAVRGSGLLQPGGLYSETVRIVLRGAASPAEAAKTLRKAMPGAGLDIRDRGDAAPGARKLIDRLEYFLSFIGLAALLAGGLGVFGAVSAYLETRRDSIATQKALGAEGPLVRNLYLIQIGLLAVLGVIIGLAIGAATPFLIGMIAGADLPVPALFAVYPAPLAKAGLFGLLAAAAFSLEPLARARATSPAALFRSRLGGGAGFSLETLGAVIAGLGLAGLTIITAPTPVMACVMIAGVAVSLGLLWALGRGAVWLSGRLRAFTQGPVRLGLANLAGPRSAARTATPAIGLGVALLGAIVLIQSSLLDQIKTVAPKAAPAVVFTEIPGDRAQAFDAVIARDAGALTPDRYLRMPLATGRITGVKGQPVVRGKITDGQRWAYDNDISLSALGPEPAGAGITEGHWWPANYSGPPLGALDSDVAKASGLRPGDHITVHALGADLDVTIAVLRKVDFGGFGPDFALVLDPAAFEGASLRGIAMAKMSKDQETRVTRDLGRDFPAVNVISVREVLETATALFDRLALAVRGAAGVAALAGVLVLAGSIAAGAGARAKEAATLKVLGAARAQILTAYVVEYGAVGLIAGLVGGGLGAAAAWPVVVKVFEAHWSVDWAGLIALIAGAALLTGLGGLIAALQALAKRPAPVLRSE